MSDVFETASRRRRAAGDQETGDRLPPWSEKAEQGVLGCILLEPTNCLGLCLERFKGRAEVFYDLKHQTIFNVLKALYEEHKGIDLITVEEELRRRGVLEEVGGDFYLDKLQGLVPTALNVGQYVETVREQYALRRLLAICTEAAGKVYSREGDVSAEGLLLEVESQISGLTEGETSAAEEPIREVLTRVVNDLEENRYIRGKTQLRGLPTGEPGNYLDKLIRGIRETFYFVVAGRPGDGKTAWAMNVVEYLASDYVWFEKTGATRTGQDGRDEPVLEERKGIPVAVFSIEMDGDSLGARFLFGRAGVDTAQFMQGFSHDQDVMKIAKAAAELSKCQIYIDPTPGQTIGQIAAKARRMVKQYGIKLFVLDYLQLVEGEETGRNSGDRVRELTKISRKIMALKKQLRVPWLVLCQMNRNIETTESKRVPVLSDLKDCGAIEQDADAVMFLYKPGRKDVANDESIITHVCQDWDWSLRPYRVNAFVAKNRFGPTGVAQLLFQKNLTRFTDWHLWKVRNGAEARNAGEGKGLIDDEDVPKG